jgi:hypothetical protein
MVGFKKKLAKSSKLHIRNAELNDDINIESFSDKNLNMEPNKQLVFSNFIKNYCQEEAVVKAIEEDEQNMGVDIEEEGGDRILISDLTEFVSNIKEEEQQTLVEEKKVNEERNNNNNIEAKKLSETEKEILFGTSLGSTINHLKNQGLIRTEEMGKGGKEEMKSGEFLFELEYTDEFGRKLTPKEAFKQLSHVFHGKGSGKTKKEKRLRRIAEELKAEKNVFDTPITLVDNGQKVDHILLSGESKNKLIMDSVEEEKKTKKGETKLVPTNIKKAKIK